MRCKGDQVDSNGALNEPDHTENFDYDAVDTYCGYDYSELSDPGGLDEIDSSGRSFEPAQNARNEGCILIETEEFETARRAFELNQVEHSGDY